MKSAILDLPELLSSFTNAPHPSSQAAFDLLRSAEEHLDSRAPLEAATWHDYLDLTGRPSFLHLLSDRRTRERWAETAFRAIRVSNYSLGTMLDRRAAEIPDHILFEDARELDLPSWSYAQVRRWTRLMAALFLRSAGTPHVAIFSENNVDAACADLACLANGILVTPLNVHFDVETLASIFHRLAVNIVVTDTDARQSRVAEAAARAGREVTVFRTGSRIGAATIKGTVASPLRQSCAQLDLQEVEWLLASRTADLFAPATVMYTSGSTGESKGLVFTQYMLVTKRFARAAALPNVGRNEVLLCYLPLFHTFGRYLEMLGTLYWRGTYVFAGNPSAEALMAEMARVRPTGLISIPARWAQIREQCLESMERGEGDDDEQLFREVVGDRLHWGLSAAGYLDPKIFRFFHRHGVDLCSGFGMTEGTGGITMTPPGAYVDGTVGVPLPGMKLRIDEHGELHISGVYTAAYLDENGAPGEVQRVEPEYERWLPTGDVFAQNANGYLSIVDRIKDIYKNSRGQTIAPQRVEQRFVDVPGIRRTFLAGDHRDYNVLLIVPDHDDPVFASRSKEEIEEYFGQIVASVNAGLPSYERVIRFELLDRDFDAEKHELTAKGTLRRKSIENHFSSVIESLYASNHVDLRFAGVTIRIPRWFFRDLGILEGDIVARKDQLVNRRGGTTLQIARAGVDDVRVGDLEYRVTGDVLDLGLLARQPRFWVGNQSLYNFSPCKNGWDVTLRNVSPHVRRPKRVRAIPQMRDREGVEDNLRDVHQLCVDALFAPEAEAHEAVDSLGRLLSQVDTRTASLIRRRLEALAFRPEENIRALAYRILLLDAPVVDDYDAFPAFVESGLSFLTNDSIAVIARARRGERRLQALRQRLYSYRTELRWPASPVTRRQFRRVFDLLADFARHHVDDLPAIQAELASWALFREDLQLARAAEKHLHELTEWHRKMLAAMVSGPPQQTQSSKVVFEFSISGAARTQLERILFDDTFVAQSIAHAFNEHFEWRRVAAEGVWVSPMLSHRDLSLYRVGVNLTDGRHFDLLLVAGDTLRTKDVHDTIFWLTALGHALGTPVFPRFGAWRRDLGAVTVNYVSELTAWDRIRELASEHDAGIGTSTRWLWRKLYVRAMSAFFRAWEQSGYRIVPGAVTPANVAVPHADFHEATSILSLAGWRVFENPLSIVRPMLRSFYRMTQAHYPQSRELLDTGWIFDACIEVLGSERAANFFEDLERAVEAKPTPENAAIGDALAEYRSQMPSNPHVPLPALCAIARFGEWERMNPAATAEAREEAAIQMSRMYRLDRFPDAFRYKVYQKTYFDRAGAEIDEAFDRLVSRRLKDVRSLAGHLDELSELQPLLTDPVDRAVFSRMVFPQLQPSQKIELMPLGTSENRRVIVRSELRDDGDTRYAVREPINAVEIGQLYRLLLEADFTVQITENDRQLVIVDAQERIVGGLSYRKQETSVVHVDAIVVAPALTNRGLGGRLLEDFCVRMSAEGAKVVKTGFFLGGLFTKHRFTVNERWGGLVRFLES